MTELHGGAMSDRSVGAGQAAAGESGRAAARAPLRPVIPSRIRPWLAAGIRLFILLLVAGLVFVAAREWDRWTSGAVMQSTDDAYLVSDLTPLAAQVSGYVRQVPVQDFERVKAGQLLVALVDDDYRARLEQAKADVAAAQAAIGNIVQQKLLQQATIKAAEATINASQADLLRYHLDAVRQRTLLAQGPGSAQRVEAATDDERRAAAALEVNRARLEEQRQQMNVLDSRERQAEATLKAQQAARDLAAINLGYTRITAPVDGMVGQRQVQRGQYVNVGTQVISIVPLPRIWVIANYRETQMTHIRIGQRAHVTVDAFPGAVLKGHVDSWSPASGAQFALLPPDNATGNFTKVVQRIPVKIVLEPDRKIGDLLRPGMSVIATIDTGSTPEAAGARAAAQ